MLLVNCPGYASLISVVYACVEPGVWALTASDGGERVTGTELITADAIGLWFWTSCFGTSDYVWTEVAVGLSGDGVVCDVLCALGVSESYHVLDILAVTRGCVVTAEC